MLLNNPNVRITGISSCVPSTVEENKSLTQFNMSELEKTIAITSIERRHVAGPLGLCTSDLCLRAAETLLADLRWDRSEIDALIYVTQTPDYILPATSPLLQNKLGLSTSCFTLDISLGCSGYIYGLSVLSSMMQSGVIKRGLLLVGDTISRLCSSQDKSTYPLFGDAGTATALQYEPRAKGIYFDVNSDGSGYEAIMVKDGAFRNMFTAQSLLIQEISPDIIRNDIHLTLDGMDVFSFGITKAPSSVQSLLNFCNLSAEDVNYFVFHQANMLMNETIRKKLKLPKEKVPYSLKDYGNTSCATIPLTINSTLQNLRTGYHKLVLCGFGVGLSWGSAYIETENLVLPEITYYV